MAGFPECESLLALRCGIVGLTNAAKSTLFNALTQAGIPADDFTSCAIILGIVLGVLVGALRVPDWLVTPPMARPSFPSASDEYSAWFAGILIGSLFSLLAAGTAVLSSLVALPHCGQILNKFKMITPL